MEMIKKYDFVEYRWDVEFNARTYCLLDNPKIVQIGSCDYYVANAVEYPFTDDDGSVPVYVIECEKEINGEDTFFDIADRVYFEDKYIDLSELAKDEYFKEMCETLMAFHKKVEERKKKYGTVTYDGEEYILMFDAMFDVDVHDNPYYYAEAIKEPDFEFNETFPDACGCVRTYVVKWDLKDEYQEDWKYRWEKEDNGEAYDIYESKMLNADESDMCEWDNPCDVLDYGDYISVDCI